MELVIAETLARRTFKHALGDVNHAYSTWIVALANLPDSSAVVPDDLEFVWHPQNVERSRIIARDAAKRSVLGLVVTSFDEFIDTLRAPPFLADHSFRSKLVGPVGARLGACQAQLESVDETGCLMDLLIFWRNRLVHGSNSRLDQATVAQLRQHAEKIRSEYVGCDIELALTHSSTRELPSNIEILALILAAQRFIRRLDRFLIEQLEVEPYLYDFVRHFLSQSGKSLHEVWCWKATRRESWLRQVASHYGIVAQDSKGLEYHSKDFSEAIHHLAQASLKDAIANIEP